MPRDVEPLLKAGTVLADRYRIVRELGQGGMGAVYEAEDQELKRRVAVKTLLPEAAKNPKIVVRFEREAEAASRIDHPSVVNMLARGKTPDGMRYLVMEYVEGEALSSYINAHVERGERIDLTLAMRIAWQIAWVLGPAHERGIVHRDLKPANLMLVSDPMVAGGMRVKILDFGVAKFLPTGQPDDGAEDGQTSTGDIQPGTASYMPPEQFSYQGLTGLESRMDVYALGVILYRMLTGRLPLSAPTAMAMMGLVLSVVPKPPHEVEPSVPLPVSELVQRMLVKSATERPTMMQVRDTLGSLIGIASKPEVVSIRPTAEVRALSKPAGTGDLEEELAATADGPNESGTPAAPGSARASSPSLASASTRSKPTARSLGDRATTPHPEEASLRSLTSGQQLTGGDRSTIRPRARRLSILGGAVVGVAAVALGVRTWISTHPRVTVTSPSSSGPAPASQPLPAPTPPEPAAPAARPPVVAGAAGSAVAAPPTGRASDDDSSTKRKTACVSPTEACLPNTLSAVQKRAFLSALDESGIKLCAGQRMVIAGKPRVTIRSAGGVSRGRQEQLVFALQAALGEKSFAGEVSVQCKGK